jgi:hypothetical protein
MTGNKDCFAIGDTINQEIVLENIGNVDLLGIGLTLSITGDHSSETIQETETIDVPVGENIPYRLEKSYTVPKEARYQVRVSASLGCAPGLIDTSHAIDECVDLHNLLIVRMDNPQKNTIDKVGVIDSLTITVENIDDHDPFINVSITALIEDRNGEVLNTLSGTIPRVEYSSTQTFTFREKYIVPNDSVYFIRIYMTTGDYYPKDDTLLEVRKTNYTDIGIKTAGTINGFTLGQNIPNPANNTTRIAYSIPEAGEIVFHVYSINGQRLYSKTIEVTSGTHSIELNTATFSAGIYFYCIEYKGQRLVKRMSVK